MDFKIQITCECGHFQQVSLVQTNTDYKCAKCEKHLFHLQIIKGFIYVLSNPAMPGLLKIGYTEKSVQERLNQLNNTGIPATFEIKAIFESLDPYADEQKIHDHFSEYRYSKNREFFSIELREVIDYISSILPSINDDGYQKSLDLLKNEFQVSEEELIRVQSNISEEDRQFYQGLSDIEILRKKLWEYKNW